MSISSERSGEKDHKGNPPLWWGCDSYNTFDQINKYTIEHINDIIVLQYKVRAVIL